MKDIDVLKQESQLCNRIWKENYEERVKSGDEFSNLDHMHVCDFELINFKYCKSRKKLNKIVENECIKYLSSIGVERDECMECCDYCIHDRYVTISRANPGLILNISTLRIDDDNFTTKGVEFLK